MDGRRQKTVKLHWLKRPKTVIKKKSLYQKNRSSKTSYSEFICQFQIFEANKKQQKKSLILQYSSTQKASLILRTSTVSQHQNVNIKKVTSVTQPKSLLTLQISQQTCSGWCHKSICTAQFLDAQELHSRSTWKANVCIFP